MSDYILQDLHLIRPASNTKATQTSPRAWPSRSQVPHVRLLKMGNAPDAFRAGATHSRWFHPQGHLKAIGSRILQHLCVGLAGESLQCRHYQRGQVADRHLRNLRHPLHPHIRVKQLAYTAGMYSQQAGVRRMKKCSL